MLALNKISRKKIFKTKIGVRKKEQQKITPEFKWFFQNSKVICSLYVL